MTDLGDSFLRAIACWGWAGLAVCALLTGVVIKG